MRPSLCCAGSGTDVSVPLMIDASVSVAAVAAGAQAGESGGAPSSCLRRGDLVEVLGCVRIAGHIGVDRVEGGTDLDELVAGC